MDDGAEEARSVLATLSSLVSLDVVDYFLNVFNGLGPDQVIAVFPSFVIEQLGGLELDLELLGVLDGSHTHGELLHLSLTLGEVLDEPHKGLVGVWHRLQYALGSIGDY